MAEEPVLHQYYELSSSHLYPDTFIELMPLSPFAHDIRQNIEKLQPRIGVETLFFLPIPEAILKKDDFPQKIYTILHASRTLEGIRYFSQFPKPLFRDLFTKAWTIDNPNHQQQITDTVFTNHIPARSRIYRYVESDDYGEVIYHIQLKYRRGSYWMMSTNLTSLRAKGIFTVAASEQSQTHLLLVPTHNGALVYGNTVIFNRLFSTHNPFFPYAKIQGSMRGALRALFIWIRDQIEPYPSITPYPSIFR